MATRNIIYGNTILSLQNHVISTTFGEIALSESEMRIFLYLLKNKRFTVERSHLSSIIDCNRRNLSTRFIDVHVSSLRKKLLRINSNLVIETAWGRGYRLISKEDNENSAN